MANLDYKVEFLESSRAKLHDKILNQKIDSGYNNFFPIFQDTIKEIFDKYNSQDLNSFLTSLKKLMILSIGKEEDFAKIVLSSRIIDLFFLILESNPTPQVVYYILQVIASFVSISSPIITEFLIMNDKISIITSLLPSPNHDIALETLSILSFIIQDYFLLNKSFDIMVHFDQLIDLSKIKSSIVIKYCSNLIKYFPNHPLIYEVILAGISIISFSMDNGIEYFFPSLRNALIYYSRPPFCDSENTIYQIIKEHNSFLDSLFYRINHPLSIKITSLTFFLSFINTIWRIIPDERIFLFQHINYSQLVKSVDDVKDIKFLTKLLRLLTRSIKGHSDLLNLFYSRGDFIKFISMMPDGSYQYQKSVIRFITHLIKYSNAKPEILPHIVTYEIMLKVSEFLEDSDSDMPLFALKCLYQLLNVQVKVDSMVIIRLFNETNIENSLKNLSEGVEALFSDQILNIYHSINV